MSNSTVTSVTTALNAPHILIIGAAYAGLSALNSLISLSGGEGYPKANQRRGPPGSAHGRNISLGDSHDKALPRALRTKPRYTILDERDGFYHTVGAPLGQIYARLGKEFWVRFDDIFAKKQGEDIRFIHGSAVTLDLESKTLGYTQVQSPVETQELSYDFLVVASGMRRRWPVVPRSLNYQSYVTDIEHWEAELSQCSKIVIIGGGACGIEMAAELKMHFPRQNIILVHSRGQLLSNEPLSDEFKFTALRLLQDQGVQVLLNTRVERDTPETLHASRSLTLSNGETLHCDKVIHSAAQQGANTDFIPASLTEEKGGCIKVRDTFQFATGIHNADVHYAIGDAAHIPSLIKRCGPAQDQGKQAAANIIATLIALENGGVVADADLQKFPPSKPSMTLAIGEQAVTMRNGLSFGKGVKLGAFGTGLGIDGSLASLGIRPRLA